MNLILFAILDTNSHLNASFKVAGALSERGYAIVYLGKPGSRAKIEDQGFGFHPRPEDFQPEILAKRTSDPAQLRKMFETNYFRGDFFGEAIRRFKPQLVLLDTSLIYYSVHLLVKDTPFITLSTKVCQDRTAYIPPFCSTYIPYHRNLFIRIKVAWIWQVHLYKRWWRDIMNDCSGVRVGWFFLVKKYLKQKSPKVSHQINTQRSSHFGWRDFPEIVLSPRHFDFPRTFPPNQVYLGPVVDLGRKEDHNALHLFDKILSGDKKTIYCSLGAYDQKHRMDRIKFFVKLINIFLLRREWQLVLSVGKDIDPSGFRPLPENVHLFQSVPQLYLIKNVDLLISHGGMQSVTECILLETPMLIFPLDQDLDQNGNSARVVYHKIGLRGKLKKDSPKAIESKIDELLANRAYFLNNLKKLRRKMLDSGDFEKGIEFIESYIQNPASAHEKG